MATGPILDVSRMTADETGVHGFVWPLSRAEVLAMRDSTLTHMASAIRSHADSQPEDSELLSIVALYLLAEAMAVYQAYALCRRLEALGHRPVPPARSRIFPAVSRHIAPAPSPLLQTLLVGPSPSSRSRWLPAPLRQAWQAIRRNGLSLRRLSPFDPAHDIVAVQQTTPLIGYHASAVSDTVRYSYMLDWFGSLDGPNSGNGDRLASSPNVIDAGIHAVQSGFAAGNEELPQYLADYLHGWLSTATGLVRCHLDTLLRRPDRLPRRLWTGSGGPIWSRILRHATRRAGGTVTGHDHAMGVGHLVYTVKMLNDFESCDVFVTLNESQASGLRSGLRADLLVPLQAPEIIGMPRNRTTRPPTREPSRTGVERPAEQSVSRTVMYPSSFYNGERMHYAVQIPDLVALDWEARLFSRLSQWGYEVLHKPHPGSVSLPRDGFTQAFGGRTLTEPFDQVMHLADAFIFVTSQSTPFISILAESKPVVFIDLGLFEWVPEAYEMLGRRCRIVRGRFDEDNRAQVDWDELRNAISEAGDLTDTAFADNYLALGS